MSKDPKPRAYKPDKFDKGYKTIDWSKKKKPVKPSGEVICPNADTCEMAAECQHGHPHDLVEYGHGFLQCSPSCGEIEGGCISCKR